MLSRCFQEVGFDVMAVDHTHNRFHPLAHICNLDLTLKSSWEFLHYVVRNFQACFVHAAPPCGTCSRAREIHLGGSKQPRPLRSSEYPHGLPHLSADEQTRVDAANSIYSQLSEFLLFCNQCQIPWAIENPQEVTCGKLTGWYNCSAWQNSFISLPVHGGRVDQPRKRF